MFFYGCSDIILRLPTNHFYMEFTMSQFTKITAASLIAILGTAFIATTASAHGEHRDWAPNNPYHAISRTPYCVHRDYWHKDGMKNCDNRGYRMRDEDRRDDMRARRDDNRRYDNNGRRY